MDILHRNSLFSFRTANSKTPKAQEIFWGFQFSTVIVASSLPPIEYLVLRLLYSAEE